MRKYHVCSQVKEVQKVQRGLGMRWKVEMAVGMVLGKTLQEILASVSALAPWFLWIQSRLNQLGQYLCI